MSDGIGLAEKMLGLPGVAVRITDAQAQKHPVVSALVQSFLALHERLFSSMASPMGWRPTL